MTRTQKIVISIVLSILTIITAISTFCSISMIITINDMIANPESYFASLRKTDLYVKVDDVAYIQYDAAVVDPKKIEEGYDFEYLSGADIFKMTNEAIAKRNEAENSSTVSE